MPASGRKRPTNRLRKVYCRSSVPDPRRGSKENAKVPFILDAWPLPSAAIRTPVVPAFGTKCTAKASHNFKNLLSWDIPGYRDPARAFKPSTLSRRIRRKSSGVVQAFRLDLSQSVCSALISSGLGADLRSAVYRVAMESSRREGWTRLGWLLKKPPDHYLFLRKRKVTRGIRHAKARDASTSDLSKSL